MDLIGRRSERDTFKSCLLSSESKLIAVYGRRRIGKTFLIRKYFDSKIRFEVAGLHKGDMSDQLLHFTQTLAKTWNKDIAHIERPATWIEAFDLLATYIRRKRDKKKKVIFIDELPWFDTPRSKFLMAFESFWNSFCSKRNDIVLIICGSAASWMINKILKNKGGLHNRVSEKIRLQQFSLYETEIFLKNKGIRWTKYDMAQLYMVTGGIPYYLDAVRKGESVGRFVDRACFVKDGILETEYEVLFQSLFDNSEHHHKIVELLAKKKEGYMRAEIISKAKLSSGGTLSNVIEELEESGFVEVAIPYGMNKTKAHYKLSDSFTIFHHKYLTGSKKSESNWQSIAQSQSWKSWSGFAFERLCFAHIAQIKKALKIEVLDCKVSHWRGSKDHLGTQIDMLIDRSDRIINLCDIKFSQDTFIINKSYAQKLRDKMAIFKANKKEKKKGLFLTMITASGTLDNKYHKELVQGEVTLKDLFAPV